MDVCRDVARTSLLGRPAQAGLIFGVAPDCQNITLMLTNSAYISASLDRFPDFLPGFFILGGPAG